MVVFFLFYFYYHGSLFFVFFWRSGSNKKNKKDYHAKRLLCRGCPWWIWGLDFGDWILICFVYSYVFVLYLTIYAWGGIQAPMPSGRVINPSIRGKLPTRLPSTEMPMLMQEPNQNRSAKKVLEHAPVDLFGSSQLRLQLLVQGKLALVGWLIDFTLTAGRSKQTMSLLGHHIISPWHLAMWVWHSWHHKLIEIAASVVCYDL